jgi:hypothetical protein
MTQFHCKYHPHQETITKCEEWGNFLCLEWKNVYRIRYTSSRSYYSSSSGIELCQEGYAIRVKKGNYPIFCIVPLIFIILKMGCMWEIT